MAGPVLTIEETALLLRTNVKKVRQGIREGIIEVIRIGRTTFVLRRPLERRLKMTDDEAKADLEGGM